MHIGIEGLDRPLETQGLREGIPDFRPGVHSIKTMVSGFPVLDTLVRAYKPPTPTQREPLSHRGWRSSWNRSGHTVCNGSPYIALPVRGI